MIKLETFSEFKRLISGGAFTLNGNNISSGVGYIHRMEPKSSDVAIYFSWVENGKKNIEELTYSSINEAKTDGEVLVVNNAKGQPLEFQVSSNGSRMMQKRLFRRLRRPKLMAA